MDRILLHEHQAHSAPGALALDGEPARKIAEKSIAALAPAVAQARECEVAWAVTDVGEEFNHVREQYFPDLGCATSWTIYKFGEDGRPHQEAPQRLLLSGWTPEIPSLKEPRYFDRPADSLVPLLVFRTPEGEVLGSVCRFAAHVHIVNCRQPGSERKKHYSWDFPGYARQRLEEVFGGMGMYLNGPCGDLTPKFTAGTTPAEAKAESQRIGQGVADAAVAAFQAAKPAFEPVRIEGFVRRTVDLPLRDTLPRSREELKEFPAKVEAARRDLNLLIEGGAWPTRIKRQVDLVQHLSVIDKSFEGWINFSDAEIASRAMTVEVEGVGLNGLVLLGLPGETLTDTCQWVRNQTLGDQVVAIDQVNGYCSYLVTRERYDIGGYAFWCSVLARDSEPLLRKTAVEVVREVVRQRGYR